MADERVSIIIDIDVKDVASIAAVQAALANLNKSQKSNALSMRMMKGDSDKTSKSLTGAAAASNKFAASLNKLSTGMRVLQKFARILLFTVIAMTLEFAVSALALASVNLIFATGRFLAKSYSVAMQALAGAVASVGVAAIGAAAAFREFTAAGSAFKFKGSDNVTAGIADSTGALQNLYADSVLATAGISSLNEAFKAVTKNSAFTAQTQAGLKAMMDFATVSGDPKGLSSAATFLGLIQKETKFTQEALAAAQQIGPEFDKAFKKLRGSGKINTTQDFFDLLKSGKIAEEAGVLGAGAIVQQTLFAQFKGYLTRLYGETSSMGASLLEPFKKTLNTIFLTVRKTLRRVSNDLIAFGQDDFVKGIVGATEKISNFSVTLFRKFLPAVDGFFGRINKVYNSMYRYTKGFLDVIRPLREGGSIIIDTFGAPISEVFKAFGRNIKSLADTAVANKEKFISFGEALRGFVASFFDMSSGFKEAFTGAIPILNKVIGAVSLLMRALGDVFRQLSKLGPLASFLGIFGAAFGAMKGRRSARRSYGRNFGAGGGGGLSGSLTGALDDDKSPAAAAINNSAAKLSGAGNELIAAGNDLTKSGTDLTLSSRNLTKSSVALHNAAQKLGVRPGHGRSGTEKFKGAKVDETGAILRRPSRQPGMTNGDYFNSLVRFENQQALAKYSPGLTERGSRAQTVVPYGSGSYGQTNVAHNPRLIQMPPNMQQFGPQDTRSPQARFRAAESAKRELQFLADRDRLPRPSEQNSSQFIAQDAAAKRAARASAAYQSYGASRMSPSQRIQSALRGAMASSSSPGLIGLTGRPSGRMFADAMKGYGKAGFGGTKKLVMKGAGSGGKFLSSLSGVGMNEGYKENMRLQQEAVGEGKLKKVSKFRAAKAGARANMGMGSMALGMGASYLGSKYGSAESQGAMQAGSALMAVSPLMGAAVMGLGTMATAQTKAGGVMSGALGGAAAGALIGSVIPGVGTALGALIGGAGGAIVGFIKAKSNMNKMRKAAGKAISDSALFESTSLLVKGSVNEAIKLAKEKADTIDKLAGGSDAAQKKEIDRLVKAGIISSSDRDRVINDPASRQAVFDKANAAGKVNVKVTELMGKTQTKNMKLLQQATGKTKEQIMDLAYKMNVNLSDPLLKVNEAIVQLGEGAVKTAKELNYAITDHLLAGLDALEKYVDRDALPNAVLNSQNSFNKSGTEETFQNALTDLVKFVSSQSPDDPLMGFVAIRDMLDKNNGIIAPGKQLGQGFTKASPEVQKNILTGIDTYKNATSSGLANTFSTQIGAQLTAADLGFADPSAGTLLESKIENLLRFGSSGEIGRFEEFSKYGNFKGMSETDALLKLDELTNYKGLNQDSATRIGNRQRLTLEKFGDTTEEDLKLQLGDEALVVLKEMTLAIAAGFGKPTWYNDPPQWWSDGLIAETTGAGTITLKPNNDTSTPRGKIGDTSTSKRLRSTLGAHSRFNSKLTGKRTVTSSLRFNNLGSPSSDHATGNAYDLTGQNLGQYSKMVNSSGGFAEFHGVNANRHLHVVPRAGDTTTSRSGSGSSDAGSANVTVNVYATSNMNVDELVEKTIRAQNRAVRNSFERR